MIPATLRWPGIAMGAVLAGLALAPDRILQPLQGQTQTFRSSVDLIAVDVRVVGKDGRPLSTLGPESFEVTLDGRRRRVVSAQFTRHTITIPPADRRTVVASMAASAPRDEPAPTTIGRTFVIAIDTASFRTLDVQVAVKAANRFIAQLAPNDAVGVFTLPYGARVQPTTTHVLARQALSKTVGRDKDLKGGEFEMTAEEIIDITAAAATQSILQSRRTAAQIMQSQRVVQTEDNAAPTSGAATEAALAQAQSLAMALEEQVIQGISGLDSLLRLLQTSPGRKTVLLLSGGMPVSDRSGGRPDLGSEIQKLGEQATYANATVHALYFDQAFNLAFAANSRLPRPPTDRTRAIYTRTLAEFSEPSGGTLREVYTGTGEAEIDRLLAETSAYYVLGVEPDQRDRDGRPHRLQVRVSQRNVDVHSRQRVVVPRSGS